jgi:hypothetical protein
VFLLGALAPVLADDQSSDLPVAGIDPGERFVLANTAYQEGNYSRAVELYSSLTAQGFDDGRIHYDLGNAYLRNGELGRAIASYLRSRARRPRDEDVQANLKFARKSTKDDIAPPEPPAVVSTLFFWHFRLSHRDLALAVLTANLLFWGVWLGRAFRRDSEVLRWLLILLLIVLLALVGSLIVHVFFDQPVAVVVPQELDAFTAPDSESIVRFKLHAGTELRVQDKRQGWVRIALPDGQQAWIEETWVEIVRR